MCGTANPLGPESKALAGEVLSLSLAEATRLCAD